MADHSIGERSVYKTNTFEKTTKTEQQTRKEIAVELRNVLPKHMHHRPERPALAGRQIVRQSVDPHVNPVLFVHRNRPRHARQRSAHAQVLRAFFDRAEHRVRAARRRNLHWRSDAGVPSPDESAETRAETACISAGCVGDGNSTLPKHPVALFDQLHWVVALFAEFLTVRLVDLRGCQKGLVGSTVIAVVAGFVQIAVAF